MKRSLVEFLDERTEINSLSLRKIREGATEIFVPDPETYVSAPNKYLPAELPVFYNPLMEINRDISILSVRYYIENYLDEEENIYYVEALAGTGIRGFRILKELPNTHITVILNDANPLATELMKFNTEQLGISSDRIKIYNYDANFLLLKLRKEGIIPNIIEIDPYGSPAPFIFNAIRAIKGKNGLLLVTATDSAPLSGKFLNAALRKYGAYIIKNPFPREIAVRTLYYMIGREATILAKRIRPLFSTFIRHFIKVIMLVNRGKKEADKFWNSVGWVSFCPVCNEFYVSKTLGTFPPFYCQYDNHGETKIIGPLWTDPIFDTEFLEYVYRLLSDGAISISTKSANVLKKIVSWEKNTSHIPFFYDIHEISRMLKMPAPKTDYVVNLLLNLNFVAGRTHFNPRGIKTDARLPQILKILKDLSEI